MLDPRLAASLVAISLCAPTFARATNVAALGSGAAQSANSSHSPSISADGRYVAFASTATNLVVEDTNGFADVFVYDLGTGALIRVSQSADGAQADGESFGASISADGRYVAFRSFASNLVIGDTNELPDVFVHDRASCTTSRVSEETLRVLASAELEDLDESEAAASIRSPLQDRGWMWPDASDDDSESALLARCAQYARGLDPSDAVPQTPAAPGSFMLLFPADHELVPSAPTAPVNVSWEASSDADSYTLEISDDPSFASFIYTASVAGTETDHDVPGGTLLLNVNYYWRVEAINASGATLASNAPFLVMLIDFGSASHIHDSMGFCFIATAAYGSQMEPEVQTLRTFRDRCLLTNAPGRAFVDWYYRNSPPLAAAIAERPAWRRTARAFLWPVVGFANVVLWSGEQPISAGALAIVLLTLAWLGVRHVRRLKRARALVQREVGLRTSPPIQAG